MGLVSLGIVAFLIAPLLRAQQPLRFEPPPPAKPAASTAETAPATPQNLLGQTNSDRGESRRNENVQVTPIDNNASKEVNTRVGTSATIITEFQPDRGYFTAELGNAPRTGIHLVPQSGSDIHGAVFWSHNNSIFSARSFFQVGTVQPARANQYGANVGMELWKDAFLSVSLSQTKNRGQVNGNVLIPLPSERTVLATDPATRAIVERYLSAFPNVTPNRPDIAERALNTNSPQSIDTDAHNGQLNQKVGSKDTLLFRYGFTAQHVDAFQFVGGQNPNTTNKTHTARINWHRAFTPRTLLDLTIGFDRMSANVLPAPGSVGPVFVQGLTGLGPPFDAPRQRAQNRYRWGATLQRTLASHTVSAGFALTRMQYNGDEPEASRGVMQFNPDFGRDGITNLRYGTPSRYLSSIGTAYRAYRNWDLQGFLGDHWQATRNLTLHLNLQWEPSTRPVEVVFREPLPFDSDWNNVGGSTGFAYRLPGKSGVLRGAYAVTFGQIFPVTYGVGRYNPPHNSRVIVQTPSLTDPLAGVETDPADPNLRTSRFVLSPNLATPYEYQYNFSWEGEVLRQWRLRAGYVGSRSHKLFFNYVQNRAIPVPGIPFTTATVSERRPDPKSFEVLDIHNGSRAYYDAGLVTLTAPRAHGLTLNASYWFSKAIDLGSDYTFTGIGNGSREAAGQSGINVRSDQKARSDFDQPHAALLQASFDTAQGLGFMRKVTRGWALSSVVLLKSGTPFSVITGADGPGLGNVDGLQGDRPMLLDPAVLGRIVGNPDSSQALLPRSAFRFINAPAEMAGNLGRNTFRKGKIANVNAALERTFVLPQDWRMTLRAESINFFNTPQFAGPGDNFASPNFAQITNTLNDGRTFRFTLRLAF